MGNILQIIKDEIIIMLIAATPISELRGAIPIGITMGFSPIHSTIISIIGNIIPVPILLILLKPILNFLGRTKTLRGFVDWLEIRTLRRSEKIKKYSIFGLFLLVAIPLPTTGAYTGCLAATLFNIDFKYAFPAIVAGIIAAGIIIFTLSSLGVHVLAV